MGSLTSTARGKDRYKYGTDSGKQSTHSEENDQFHYKESRSTYVKELQRSLKKNEFDIALSYLVKLRQSVGLDKNGSNSLELCFILEEFGIQQVLTLTRLLRTQPKGWISDAEILCHHLLAWLGPPPSPEVQRQDRNGLLVLNLTGTDLGKKERINAVATIITNNRELRSVQLAFTKLDDDSIKKLLPALAGLRSLAHLGLRGNKLQSNTMNNFVKMLDDKSNFPNLMWIDLQNNANIDTLPEQLLDELKFRWPDVSYRPTQKTGRLHG